MPTYLRKIEKWKIKYCLLLTEDSVVYMTCKMTHIPKRPKGTRGGINSHLTCIVRGFHGQQLYERCLQIYSNVCKNTENCSDIIYFIQVHANVKNTSVPIVHIIIWSKFLTLQWTIWIPLPSNCSFVQVSTWRTRYPIGDLVKSDRLVDKTLFNFHNKSLTGNNTGSWLNCTA